MVYTLCHSIIVLLNSLCFVNVSPDAIMHGDRENRFYVNFNQSTLIAMCMFDMYQIAYKCHHLELLLEGFYLKKW